MTEIQQIFSAVFMFTDKTLNIFFSHRVVMFNVNVTRIYLTLHTELTTRGRRSPPLVYKTTLDIHNFR